MYSSRQERKKKGEVMVCEYWCGLQNCSMISNTFRVERGGTMAYEGSSEKMLGQFCSRTAWLGRIGSEVGTVRTGDTTGAHGYQSRFKHSNSSRRHALTDSPI